MKIRISSHGQIRFIYKDALLPLINKGISVIKRASSVEPNLNGQWEADMKACGGPKLGPFNLRDDALKAEVKWLEENGMPIPE